jgi:predicted O-methyltransferase YrrM
VRQLLAVLCTGRQVAEIGTSYGEGAEAMAQTAAFVVTVEIDPERAAVARKRLAPFANVEALEGDATELLPPRAPFELLFLDGSPLKRDQDPAAIELVRPGGLIVMDDFTPDRPGPDPVRDFWKTHPALVTTELLVTPQMAVLIAARR